MIFFSFVFFLPLAAILFSKIIEFQHGNERTTLYNTHSSSPSTRFKIDKYTETGGAAAAAVFFWKRDALLITKAKKKQQHNIKLMWIWVGMCVDS